MKAIAFSRDRAMQCHAMLESLAMHASGAVEVSVLYKATTSRHQRAYDQLAALHPQVTFHCEGDFETDARGLLAAAGEGRHKFVMFLVDDTIFVGPWSAHVRCLLDDLPRAFGISLRLGQNTVHCYPTRIDQCPPVFDVVAEIDRDVLAWHWRGADGDFGYPLELSSSIYRTADIIEIIERKSFRNPNELEAQLAASIVPETVAWTHPRPCLLCFPQSVAFSVPCNRVQSTYANRAGSDPALTAETLLHHWEQGYRIDVAALAGHVPRACHEEVPLTFVRRG